MCDPQVLLAFVVAFCSHSKASTAWEANRRFGIAARSASIAATLLRNWSEAGPHREVGEMDCVLER
jgi:hypothetical protein